MAPHRIESHRIASPRSAVHSITSQRVASHCVAMHGSRLPARAKTRAGACETRAGACETHAGTSPASGMVLYFLAPHHIESHRIVSHHSAVHSITSQRVASHCVAMHGNRLPVHAKIRAGRAPTRVKCAPAQVQQTASYCPLCHRIALNRIAMYHITSQRCA